MYILVMIYVKQNSLEGFKIHLSGWKGHHKKVVKTLK